MMSEGLPSPGRQMSPAPAEGILPPTITKQAAWLDEASALCHSQQLTAHASVTATKEPKTEEALTCRESRAPRQALCSSRSQSVCACGRREHRTWRPPVACYRAMPRKCAHTESQT